MVEKGKALLLAFVAGIAGGIIASHLARVVPALAQTGPAKLISAEEFRPVDVSGAKHGEFRIRPDGTAELLIYGRDGRVVWSAPQVTPRVLPLR